MAIQFHDLPIAGIVQETHDARSYLFDVPANLKEAFRYRAGQFMTFEIPWQDMRIRRCYSLSSAPEVDAWHKVTVKRVADGRVSNWFYENLRVGDIVSVQPPEGRFLLHDTRADQKLVLIGGGSGITPLISLIKSALTTTKREIKLIYANRDRRSVIFHDELELWKKRYPERLEIHHHLDDAIGFLTRDLACQLLKNYESADFYVCGPTPLMDLAEQAFQVVGIARERMHFERFVSPVDPDRKAPESADVSVVNAADVPATFRVRSEGKTFDVPYTPGLTLLQSSHAAGFKAPSSCEDGYCGCCMALLKTGKVQMKTHEALTKADIERGWILCCQARPVNADPIEIDYDAQY